MKQYLLLFQSIWRFKSANMFPLLFMVLLLFYPVNSQGITEGDFVMRQVIMDTVDYIMETTFNDIHGSDKCVIVNDLVLNIDFNYPVLKIDTRNHNTDSSKI